MAGGKIKMGHKESAKGAAEFLLDTLAVKLFINEGKDIRTTMSTEFDDEPIYYGDDDSEESEYVQHFSKIIDFKKIKALRFDDDVFVNKIVFKPWKDFYKFKNTGEAAFEADYGLAYVLYKYGEIYDTIPAYLTLRNEVLHSKFYDKFFESTDIPKDCYDFNHTFDNKDMELGHFYISMDRMILYFDGHTSFLVYPPEYLKDQESPLWVILGVVKKYKNPATVKNKIYVVYKTQHGFQKKSFSVNKRKINLEDNYNVDFPEVSKDIITKLNDKKKTGLVILHGEPGTGKTTYIRYLASKLTRDIIFISPDMVQFITSPEFIPFLMSNSNCILIIEDAEPALQTRQGDGRSGAVSNILNMTDGLLSDCLNISMVATFNTTTKDIDKALLRKGRLLQEYEFGKLELDKSQALLDKIGKKATAKEPMSLAEIYFYGDENTRNENLGRKITVGFGKN